MCVNFMRFKGELRKVSRPKLAEETVDKPRPWQVSRVCDGCLYQPNVDEHEQEESEDQHSVATFFRDVSNREDSSCERWDVNEECCDDGCVAIGS